MFNLMSHLFIQMNLSRWSLIHHNYGVTNKGEDKEKTFSTNSDTKAGKSLYINTVNQYDYNYVQDVQESFRGNYIILDYVKKFQF